MTLSVSLEPSWVLELLDRSVQIISGNSSGEYWYLPPIPVVYIDIQAVLEGTLSPPEPAISCWRCVVKDGSGFALVDFDEHIRTGPSSIMRGQLVERFLKVLEEVAAAAGGDHSEISLEVVEIPELHTIALSLVDDERRRFYPVQMNGGHDRVEGMMAEEFLQRSAKAAAELDTSYGGLTSPPEQDKNGPRT